MIPINSNYFWGDNGVILDIHSDIYWTVIFVKWYVSGYWMPDISCLKTVGHKTLNCLFSAKMIL
jgi:hypothetical protein